MSEGQKPYRVTVQSPLLHKPHVEYFDTYEDGEAFMDRCQDEGLRLPKGMTILPKAVGNMCLEGLHGITVRPEPAVMVPSAST